MRIVCLVIDAVRPDHFGRHGYCGPRIDDLAARKVRSLPCTVSISSSQPGFHLEHVR